MTPIRHGLAYWMLWPGASLLPFFLSLMASSSCFCQPCLESLTSSAAPRVLVAVVFLSLVLALHRQASGYLAGTISALYTFTLS